MKPMRDRWEGKAWLKSEPKPPGLPKTAEATRIWSWVKRNAPTGVVPADLPLLDMQASAKLRLQSLGLEPGEGMEAKEWLAATKAAIAHYERATFELRKKYQREPPLNPHSGRPLDSPDADLPGIGRGRANQPIPRAGTEAAVI